MCSSNDSRSCQFCSHILTLEWLCSGLLQTNQKHTWHANICKQICSPSQIACLSMWNIRHRQRWIVVINMAWDEDVCARKKEQLLATNFTCFAWHHVNALEMCNEEKTKGGKRNKDELPQGNHYHTSLLLTTRCNEDRMLQDAYSPGRQD